MQVTNIQDVLKEYGAAASAYLPRFDSFEELASRARTEVVIDREGTWLFRKCFAKKPLSEQTPSRESKSQPELAGHLLKGEQIVISIDTQLCFSHRIKLPLSAEGKVDAILELELARITPFARDSVIAGWIKNAPSDTDGGFSVDQIVVRKDVYAEMAELTEKQGAKIIGVMFRDNGSPALPVALSLDGTPFAAAKFKAWSKFAAASFCLMLLGLAALSASVLTWQSQALALIEEHSGKFEKDAATARDQISRIREEYAEVSALQNRKSAYISRARLIEELSRLLPDNAHLNGLSMDADRIVADGGAAFPEPLVARLEASPHFRNAAFNSPVFRNPGEEMSRFSIKLEIESSARKAPE